MAADSLYNPAPDCATFTAVLSITEHSENHHSNSMIIRGQIGWEGLHKMPRQSLPLGQLFPILFASSLVLLTHSLWAQKSPPPELGILPEAPRSQTKLYENPFHFSYHYNLINPQTVFNLHVPTGAAALLGKSEHFNFSASSYWSRLINGRARYARYSTIKSADLLQHYGHRIPWANSSMQRVSQEARAHPRVASVVKLFTPF